MNIASITIRDIKKSFQQGAARLEVLKGILATFERDRTYAITGVSGTGKSTLLHIIAGLDSVDEGAVLYDDRALTTLSDQQRSILLNKRIGLVFQLPYVLKELSVVENVMLPGLIAGVSKQECHKKAEELLKHVGLTDKITSAVTTLSGGQQQRVALARALFNEPDFLLADEPTGNLDIETGKAMVDLLLDCHKKWHMGIIISSHDQYVAQQMETVFKLEHGVLTEGVLTEGVLTEGVLTEGVLNG